MRNRPRANSFSISRLRDRLRRKKEQKDLTDDFTSLVKKKDDISETMARCVSSKNLELRLINEQIEQQKVLLEKLKNREQVLIEKIQKYKDKLLLLASDYAAYSNDQRVSINSIPSGDSINSELYDVPDCVPTDKKNNSVSIGRIIRDLVNL